MIQENPQYFDPPKAPSNGYWNNWEDALLWIVGLAVVIALLVLYKYLRKLF